MDRKDSQKVDGVQLIRIIANKNKDQEAARKALDLFVGYFDDNITQMIPPVSLK